MLGGVLACAWSRADALPDNRNHCQAHGLSGDTAKRVRYWRQRSRQSGPCEGSNDVDDQDSLSWNMLVFQGIRNADIESVLIIAHLGSKQER